MAYVKTTWATGDVITAEKLNNAEGGIEAAYPLIVVKSEYVDGENRAVLRVGGTDYQLDKTYSEIFTALSAGKLVMIMNTTEDAVNCDYILYADYTNEIYSVASVGGDQYYSSTADGTLTTVLPE